MKVNIDTDSSDGTVYLNEPTVFYSKDEFERAYPGNVPHPMVLGRPNKYPVLVFDLGESENFSGREIATLLYFYDFEIDMT